MYFWGFRNTKNIEKDDGKNIEKDSIAIEVGEERGLLEETAEIISYDDLNMCKDTSIADMSVQESIPRPTLVVPKSPKYQPHISESDSGSDIEISNSKIANMGGDNNNNNNNSIDEIGCASPISVDNEEWSSICTHRKIFYPVSFMTCSVIIYLSLYLSGIV